MLVKNEDKSKHEADIDKYHEPVIENLASRNEVDREGKESEFEDYFDYFHGFLDLLGIRREEL